MAYNPYSAVNAIYKLKGQWDDANKAGNTTAKNDVATKAQEYYKQLRDNGYSDVADQLTASSYAQSKAINDKWAKMGKTATRPYLYSLGKSYGMSTEDIDNLIGWDNETGEVSFGGKKIGTPDAGVDGVSYWSDTSVLDNAFNDYISRSGTTRSKSVAVDQENENLFSKYKEAYDNLTKTNPFTTDEAKAILGKYSLAGLQARDNAAASGGASNGGNIDSYSAANAMRQQASLLSQGQSKVLDAHQQKIDNVRGLLSDMGVNIDRVFNQDETAKQSEFDRNETAKNNEMDNWVKESAITGKTPLGLINKNNPYLNADGTIKDQYKDVDFSAVMAKAKASGDTAGYDAAAVARYYKIMGNYGLYGKYDDGNYKAPVQEQSEEGRQFDANNQLSKDTLAEEGRQFDVNNDTVLKTLETETGLEKYKTDADNKNNLDQIVLKSQVEPTKESNLTGSQATTALKNGELNETILAAYNKAYGTSYTMKNPPPVYDAKKAEVIGNTLADAWMEKLNMEVANEFGEQYTAITKTGNTYKRGDIDASFIIKRIMGSDELTQEEKEQLLYEKFKISPSEVSDAVADKHYDR